jgi:ATP-dependent Clp protease ATP-binding subunit ClpB
MNMEKLTTKFQQALADAQSLAVGRDHQIIEPVHLFAALLDQQGGGTRHLLATTDTNVDKLRSSIAEILDQQAQVEGNAGEVHISNQLGQLLNVADKYAQQRNDQFIST